MTTFPGLRTEIKVENKFISLKRVFVFGQNMTKTKQSKTKQNKKTKTKTKQK